VDFFRRAMVSQMFTGNHRPIIDNCSIGETAYAEDRFGDLANVFGQGFGPAASLSIFLSHCLSKIAP